MAANRTRTDTSGTRAGLTLSEFTDMVRNGWPDDDIYRFMIHDLPRRFHGLDREAQRAVLAERPPLTGTRWDALLAATVEHVAHLHGLDHPAWVDEPGRFTVPTWIPLREDRATIGDAAWCPGAFLRHGTLVDPRSLDRRGGEIHVWTP